MSYNTASVHKLASFEIAKTWYEKTKPIRGNAENIRPLGSRRHHYMASIDMPNADTVCLKFFGQTLVEWRSNNTYSVFAPKYYSAFAPDNMHNFLPLSGQHFMWDKGRMVYCSSVGRGSEAYVLERGGRLDFQMVGGRSFFLNAPVAHNVRAKRGVANKLMHRYADFLSWMQVVLAVTPVYEGDELNPSIDQFGLSLGYMTNEEYSAMNSDFATPALRDEYWDERYNRDALPFGFRNGGWDSSIGFNREACLRMQSMILGNDTSDWVQTLHVIVSKTGRYTWSPRAGKKVSEDKAYEFVKHLVTYLHRDEVFTLERLPKGTIPSKTNTQYYHDVNFVPRKRRQGVDKSNQSTN
jgi:hypothetical protein